MNFNLYLPDDLGGRAKSEGLKLSRLLRDAVTKELERKDALAATLGEPLVYEVNLVTADGAPYIGRITGRRLVEADVSGPFDVYLASDGRVILYHADDQMVHVHESAGEDLVNVLKDALSDAEFIAACQALGVRPVVDL
jgi:post-segregation antitoxin (ccd killing protein)